MTPRTQLGLRIWPWLLAVIILGPALLPGYVLSYDMVFVPELALRADFLGAGSSLPRAVPSDALVALLDDVVPGMLLQKGILLVSLGLAGAGARRLVPGGTPLAQLATTTLYVWNPFVAERLGIGHWPLLLTYAALPWIFDATRRARAGERTLPSVVLWVALGSLSASGGVIVSVFAVLCTWLVGGQKLGRVAAVAIGTLLVNAPWLVTGALHGGAALSDPAGVDAFASRSEGHLPLVLTVLGLGGIWNQEVVPPTRVGWPAGLAVLLVLAICAAGVRAWLGWSTPRERAGLLAAAFLGVVVTLSGAAAPDLMKWLGSSVPGGGLFRDGARFLALLAPLEAVLFGAGVSSVALSLRPHAVRVAASTLLALVPLAIMPDAGLGLNGRLRAVDFPQEFFATRLALDERLAAGRTGELLLLPFSTYRRPAWNHGRRTLDPLGRFMAPDFLASDRLFVSGRPIRGEDLRARRVEQVLLESPDALALSQGLRAEGIAWVLVDREAEAAVGSAAPSVRPTGEGVLFDGELLTLWELPGPVDDVGPGVPILPLAAAWASALATVLILLSVRWRPSRKRATAPAAS